MASSTEKCPVDHNSPQEKCPVDHNAFASSSADKCPVDHGTRWSWFNLFGSKEPDSNGHPSPDNPHETSYPQAPTYLPKEREVSSIPRADGSKWVYPSQSQFYAAMARKNHNPQASDMKVVVPIHNAVNERAWLEIQKWEEGQGGDQCGGLKLVSFKGKPNERTPRAQCRTLLGYSPPFDRHDWIVDRCGTRLRYVIDFYTGRPGPSGNVSFYLDVRPALDNWEGVRLRTQKFLQRWAGDLWTSASTTPSPRPTSAKSTDTS